MNNLIIFPILIFTLLSSINKFDTPKIHERFPSFNQHYPPPENETNIFKLSQNYPDTFSSNKPLPWSKINFKKEPYKFMNTILNYCVEGNIEADFKVENNKIRNWYHTPWLHDDGNILGNGREYKRGLTRERGTPKFELHHNQDIELENWAIGFYNDRGGYTIGKVWKDSLPKAELSNFPEGTVSFKLLFTDGTVDKVPFLKGSLEWEANIYESKPTKQSDTIRINRTLRLLQIDIAVKDKRAGEVGWIFGTFVYNGFQKGKTIWNRMAPVGLSWGDDGSVLRDLKREGAFINPELRQTILNPELVKSEINQSSSKLYLTHHGLGGRLNGPVDNPISSCISCHGKAAVDPDGIPAPMANFQLTRNKFDTTEFKKYFSLIPGGTGILVMDGKNYTKTDYSLQISAGIRNFYRSIPYKPANLDSTKTELVDRGEETSIQDSSFSKNPDTLVTAADENEEKEDNNCCCNSDCSCVIKLIIILILIILFLYLYLKYTKRKKIEFMLKRVNKLFKNEYIKELLYVLTSLQNDKVVQMSLFGIQEITKKMVKEALELTLPTGIESNNIYDNPIGIIRKLFIITFLELENLNNDIQKKLYSHNDILPYLNYLLSLLDSDGYEADKVNSEKSVKEFLKAYKFNGVLELLSLYNNYRKVNL